MLWHVRHIPLVVRLHVTIPSVFFIWLGYITINGLHSVPIYTSDGSPSIKPPPFYSTRLNHGLPATIYYPTGITVSFQITLIQRLRVVQKYDLSPNVKKKFWIESKIVPTQIWPTFIQSCIISFNFIPISIKNKENYPVKAEEKLIINMCSAIRHNVDRLNTDSNLPGFYRMHSDYMKIGMTTERRKFPKWWYKTAIIFPFINKKWKRIIIFHILIRQGNCYTFSNDIITIFLW